MIKRASDLLKFNELFNGGRLSKSIKWDKANLVLGSFVKKITRKIPTQAEYEGEIQEYSSIQDGLDYILESVRLNNKQYKVLDIENYDCVEMNEISEEYGFEMVYLALDLKNFDHGNQLTLNVLISDKRYTNEFISKLKHISGFIQKPGFIAGKLLFKY